MSVPRVPPVRIAPSTHGRDASCVRQKIYFVSATAFSLPLLLKKGGEGRGEEALFINSPLSDSTAVELRSADFSPLPHGTRKCAGSGMNSALQVRSNSLNSMAVLSDSLPARSSRGEREAKRRERFACRTQQARRPPYARVPFWLQISRQLQFP